jgi:D-3-phosphoglycerate dehydrogenase
VHVLVVEEIDPVLAQMLTQHGCTCHCLPKATQAEVESLIANYEVLVLRSKIKADRSLISKAKKLQIIGRLGSGMELIDMAYATQKGITCLSSPEGNCDAVGEHTVGLLLSLLRNIAVANAQMLQNIWQRQANIGTQLSNKTIGIIGYGHTGMAFARRLQGFDAQVLAYDKYKTNYGNQWAKQATMAKIFKQADIVSLHVPLNKTTHHLVTTNWVKQFTKPIYLINTSRGEVLLTQEMLPLLEQQKILGLALDVFETEPATNTQPQAWFNVFKQLQTKPNVLLTPHIAGVTHQAYIKMATVLATKIINQLNKK